jgi:hypothetical protein
MCPSAAQQDAYGLKVEEQLNACTSGPVSLCHLLIRVRGRTIQDVLYVDTNVERIVERIHECG